MSSPKSSAKRPPRPSPELRPKTRPSAPGSASPPEVVDPTWLVSALALSFLAALICAWLTACLLFYQGDWQLILHPTQSISRTPADANLPYESIRFDAAETGQPRLTAWWIPAQASPQPTNHPTLQTLPKYASFTILYLHDGSLSLSANVPALARLHQAGINVFAIDYRSFGQSDASAHPTQARMVEDTSAALAYLTSTRHIPASAIIPYGVGLGASLAASLAVAHPELPAVILDNPDPDPTATAVASHPSRIIPIRLLFREHFDIATPLATLTTPKLLIAGGPNSTNDAGRIDALQTLFRHAHSPSLTVTLPPTPHADEYQIALTRFLDQYLPAPMPTTPAR